MKKYSNAFHNDLFNALDQVLEDFSHNFSVFDSGRVFWYVVRFVQSMVKPVFNPTCTRINFFGVDKVSGYYGAKNNEKKGQI